MKTGTNKGVFHRRAIGLAAACLSLALAWPAMATVPWTMNLNTNNVITVTNPPYNAMGNGAMDNTLAISNAIVQAAMGGNTNGWYGGTVRIPSPGVFLCGPLTLKNNVNLQIDSGATLKMLPLSLFTSYPAQNSAYSYGSLIYAAGATNLEISGAGIIDGNGADWWSAGSDVFNNRPYMIFFNGNCKRVLIQDVTVQNPPKMHFVFKGSGNSYITFQGMTINTTAFNAANTDGIDLLGTNCLIQNCTINAGDDNLALGSSSASAFASDIVVTNCAFGAGHGVSIGSNTAGAVSNLTVINCTFNGTDYGIRMKSNDATSGGSGQGGMAQNLNYFNLGMTNIGDGAIVIYSYYGSGGEFGTPTGVSPFFAATQAVAATSVPVWRNITISNVTATVTGGGVPGIVWGRLEVPVTNLVFNRVNLSGPQPFEVYNASGVQFIDCQITPPAGSNTFLFFNAQVTISNTTAPAGAFTFDGLTTNVPGSVLNGNALTLYNAQASLRNTNVLAGGPLALNASTLTVSNNLALLPATVLNYGLGADTTQIAVAGNLALGGTINVTAGAGFTNGSYVLLTDTGILSGNVPALGQIPSGYNYAFDTNTAGMVKLVVSLPAPPAPTNLIAAATNLQINLSWNGVAGATGYNLKRGTTNNGPYPTVFGGLTATNYFDAVATNRVVYYYVVTALASGVESTNSLQASAMPLPSSTSPNLGFQLTGSQLQLSWPQDHIGWSLQVQTNSASTGLGTNWTLVPNSAQTNQVYLPVDAAKGSVFLRLIY